MTPHETARLRLLNQQIACSRSKTPAEVVAAMGAMQAQDFLGALWSIGLRLSKATEREVEQAIEERTIVRSWPMRGTLHFVAAPDLRWMLEAFTARVVARTATRRKQLELDVAVLNRSRKLLERVLANEKQLSRNEVYELLEKAGIKTGGQRGYHILFHLAMNGIICCGPRAGKQPTFVLLDEWIPKSLALDRTEAIGELARRYFTSHGPATAKDFAWWTGLTVSDAKAGIAMNKSALHEIRNGSDSYFLGEPPAATKASGSVHLLPGFDELLLGYADRSASLSPIHADKTLPGNNGMFLSTITRDGRVIGTWKRELKSKSVIVKPSPFAKFSTAESRGFDSAVKRYAAYLGTQLDGKRTLSH